MNSPPVSLLGLPHGLLNRLEVTSHEDIDCHQAPHVVPFVNICCRQAKEWYDADLEKIGRARMIIGNAIRIMARALKSRMGDHFQAAVGLRNLLEYEAPEVPDFALDRHTQRGRRMGRGLAHFRTDGAVLVPEPATDNPYVEEAYRLWNLRQSGGQLELGAAAKKPDDSAGESRQLELCQNQLD